MPYKIIDNNHILKLTLNSREEYTSPPSLYIYVNDGDTPSEPYESTTNVTPFVYEIPHSDYNVGDILTKFQLVQDTEVYPWETSEGVSIIVDGVEYDNLATNSYTSQFPLGVHNIQLFYVGNDEYNMAVSDKYSFVVGQIPTDDSGDPENDGAYDLIFISKDTESVYQVGKNIILQLRKGGVPVGANKVVEVYEGNKKIGTHRTDSKGKVETSTKDWLARKYVIGGVFTADSKAICKSPYRTFEVKKAPVTITIDGGEYRKGSVIKFYLHYNATSKSQGTPIAEEKVTLTTNGKAKTLKTDKNGMISYTFGSKDTFKFKVSYMGNKNVDKKDFTTTITITE